MPTNKKEYMNEYIREYNLKKKAEGKIPCDCGGSYYSYKKHKHVKTKFHLTNIQNSGLFKLKTEEPELYELMQRQILRQKLEKLILEQGVEKTQKLLK